MAASPYRFLFFFPISILLGCVSFVFTWLTSTMHVEGTGLVFIVDSLDVGDQASEAAHRYSVTNSTYSGRGYWCLGKGEHDIKKCGSRLTKENIRSNRGVEKFTAHVTPGSELLLVRRYDRYSHTQNVSVTINDTQAGSWLYNEDTDLSVHVHSLDDAVFTIPKELVTSSELAISLNFSGGNPDVNAAHYWVVSNDRVLSSIIRRSLRPFVFLSITALLFLSIPHLLPRLGSNRSYSLAVVIGAPLVWLGMGLPSAVVFVVFMSLYSFGVSALAKVEWPQLAILFALLTLTFGAIGPFYMMERVTQRMPLENDDWSYINQSRLFASGRMWGPVASAPSTQMKDQVIEVDNLRVSRYAPGHSFALALGSLFNNPWIIPPILAAITALGIFTLALIHYNALQAGVAGFLVVTSPMFLIMGATTYSHVTSACALTWFMVAFSLVLKTGRVLPALLGGAFLGLAILTRPFTALVVGFPFIVCSCWIFASSVLSSPTIRDYFRKVFPFALLGVVTLAFIAVQLRYNQLQTGNPFLFGFNLYDKSDQVSFALAKSCGNGISSTCIRDTLAARVTFIAPNVIVLFSKYVGWPILPPMLLVGYLFLSLRAKTFDYLLLAAVVSQIFGYSCYWFAGANWAGPIYLYETLIALIILTTRGLFVFTEGLMAATPRWVPVAVYPSLAAALCCSNIHGLFVKHGDGCLNNRSSFCSLSELRYQSSARRRVIELARALPAKKSIVFLRWTPKTNWNARYFVNQNSPLLNDKVLFSTDLGDYSNQALATSQFGDRVCYLLVARDGGTIVPCP